MTNDNTMDAGEWLPVAEAAEKLQITENSLRTRIHRKGMPSSIRSRKGNDGRLQAWVPDDLTDGTDSATDGGAVTYTAPESSDYVPAAIVDEIRRSVADIHKAYEGRIDDLKAVAVELADRGTAEIERMQASHRDQLVWLDKAYSSEITDLRDRLDQAKETEGEVRQVLLDLLRAMGTK